MARKRPTARPGTLVVLEHTSAILKGNPLAAVGAEVDRREKKIATWLEEVKNSK